MFAHVCSTLSLSLGVAGDHWHNERTQCMHHTHYIDMQNSAFVDMHAYKHTYVSKRNCAHMYTYIYIYILYIKSDTGCRIQSPLRWWVNKSSIRVCCIDLGSSPENQDLDPKPRTLLDWEFWRLCAAWAMKLCTVLWPGSLGIARCSWPHTDLEAAEGEANEQIHWSHISLIWLNHA